MPSVNPPIKVAPLPDESPTSWIMRIFLKYRISLRDLISIYELQELMKEPVNITADLSPLSIFLPEGTVLPNTVQNKIESFEWKKGRSDWLIYPNKKGSVIHNSYTQICPKCLREKGYYQLKWQFRVMEFCVECKIRLIEKCPKCKSSITSLISSSYWNQSILQEVTTRCRKCNYQLTKTRPRPAKPIHLDEYQKLINAYSEYPVNLNYLKFLKNDY